MVRPTDQDMTAIEKIHTTPCRVGAQGEPTTAGQEAKGSLKITWQEPLLWFACNGTGEAG